MDFTSSESYLQTGHLLSVLKVLLGCFGKWCHKEIVFYVYLKYLHKKSPVVLQMSVIYVMKQGFR